MDDDSVIDKGWDALPEYTNKGEADDAVTVSLSTTPGEWLVNTNDAVVVPMSMAEVVEALQKRKLTERSLVWRAGMQEWAPVDKVPQLKLAARLPIESSPTPSAPPPSVVPRPTLSSKPPPKPVRSSSPSAAPSAPPPAVSVPSRKATLPFGLPTNNAASRPANARPSSSPRATPAPPSAGPPPATEDTGVIAVYSRPAATISFDLSPEKPLQAEAVVAPTQRPQTLAPLTSDSAPRRMSPPPSADLSVVAAAHFRQAQKSSKRLVLVSSIASAAAASLLTFYMARNSDAPSPVLAQPAAAPVAAATLAPPPEPPKVEPPAPAPEVAAAASAAPAAANTTEQATPKPAPKPHKARPTKLASVTVKAKSDDTEGGSKQPSAEPNPYDVKLDEEPPKAKATAEVAHGSGLDDAKPGDVQAASGSATPGF